MLPKKGDMGRHEEISQKQYLVPSLGVHLPKCGPRLWAKLGFLPSLPNRLRTGGTFSSGTFLEVKDGSKREGNILKERNTLEAVGACTKVKVQRP